MQFHNKVSIIDLNQVFSKLLSTFSVKTGAPEFKIKLLSLKCITFLTLLFGFIIYQFYSASIVGSLLMTKPKTIKTLKDLIDSDLKIAIEDIVYTRDYFIVSIIF